MADKPTIGAGMALDGEKEFKQAVSNINKDLSVLASEMKKVTAQYSDNAGSLEALNATQDVYNKRADAQRKKIEELKAALFSATKELGENSDQARSWQIQLNNAEAELAKTENALKATTAQIDNFGKESEDSGKEIEKAGKQAKNSGDDAEKGQSGWSKLGDGLSKIGGYAAKAVAALGTAAISAATGVAAITVKAAQSADEINTLAKQTGLSVEEIQKFQYASEQIDVPLETLTGSMAKLTRNMESARQGSKQQVGAFEALGVAITDNEGNLRSNQAVFDEAIAALGTMENETQRDALAMQIFGKSAQDLNPLILGGADALQKLGDEADAAGLILEQDALDKLNGFADAMDTFKATLSGSGSLFATAFAGPMAEGLNELTGYMQELAGAFKDGGFDGLAEKFGEVLSKLVEKITGYMPQIVDLGLKVVTALIDGIVENLPVIVQGALTIVTKLVDAILNLLPTLLEAGLQIVLQLASGIADALPELIPAIVDTVLTIVETLIDNIDMLIDAALAIVLGLADGILDALPMLIDKVPTIIIKLVTAIINNLPKIIEAGIQIIIALAGAMIKAVPQLVAKIPQIIGAVIKAFGNIHKQMGDIGKNIIIGLWNGINDMGAWIKEKLSGFVTGIVDGIKDFFGIHSPSTVFAGIGGNLSAGLAEGITDKAFMVSDALNKMSKDLTADANVNVTGAAASGAIGYGTAVSNIYMDSVLVASASSKAQYRKNAGRARSYGMVPA